MGRRFEILNTFRDKGINLPRRKTCMSAGYDLEAGEAVIIDPGEVKLIPTGLKVYMPPDEFLALYVRSSTASKIGLMLVNGTGIIDADYVDNAANQGHIQLPVYNFTTNPVTVKKGQAIAQGIFQKYYTTADDEVKMRRQGGFGSTDIRS